jgi:hypothetical protein
MSTSQSRRLLDGGGHRKLCTRWRGIRHTIGVAPLEAWLAVAKIEDGPIFVSIGKGDRISPNQLSDNAIGEGSIPHNKQPADIAPMPGAQEG